MSRTTHPFYTDFDKLAEEFASFDLSARGKRLEQICKDYACRAAGIMGDDVNSIQPAIWYRHDGWEHGGSAISWRERAEGLEKERDELISQREDCLAALGEHPDSSTDIAAEIGRLRDENRAQFHAFTNRIRMREELERVNLELARLAEEEREKENGQ